MPKNKLKCPISRIIEHMNIVLANIEIRVNDNKIPIVVPLN